MGSGSPLAGQHAAGLPRTFREERFYYDGIRRIQEVVIDTLVNPELVTEPAPPVSRLSREYVWGPGGVDELLAQFEGAAAGTSTAAAAAIQARPWFALLDGGGDVVALVEVPLASSLDPVPQGRVAGQWTYDAYGAVTSAETLQAFPALHAGHKGLFVDRLDVPVAQTSTDGITIVAETPRLVPLSQGLYQNRNRTYAPGLGRFMQQDPNATAMVLMESGAYHGSGMSAVVAAFSMEGMYGDGGNMYQYLRSDPHGGSDPLGLYDLDDGYDFSEFGEDVVDILGMMDPLPGPADYIRETLRALTEDYSANLEWDADWAMDWNQDDNWHSRGSSEWVTLAIGRGLHDAMNVDLPFTERSANPLDGFAAATVLPGGEPGYRNVMGKPMQRHHIATNKGGYRTDFEKLFKKAGMSLDDPANVIDIPHSGRHNRAYHEFVLKRLELAIGDLQGSDAQKAIKRELKMIGDFIKSNPHFLYDTSKRAATGWRNMRKFVTSFGKTLRYRGRR